MSGVRARAVGSIHEGRLPEVPGDQSGGLINDFSANKNAGSSKRGLPALWAWHHFDFSLEILAILDLITDFPVANNSSSRGGPAEKIKSLLLPIPRKRSHRAKEKPATRRDAEKGIHSRHSLEKCGRRRRTREAYDADHETKSEIKSPLWPTGPPDLPLTHAIHH